MKKLRVVIAQINSVAGDIRGNTKKIISQAIYAHSKLGAQVVIFPEMSLSGYPLSDLLFKKELHLEIKTALKIIKIKTKNFYLIMGIPAKIRDKYFNQALVLHRGKIVAQATKQKLSIDRALNEHYYFSEGCPSTPFNLGGIKTAITIGEDLFTEAMAITIAANRIKLVCSLNATAFERELVAERQKLQEKFAKKNRITILSSNLVGAQDSLIFEGGSMATNSIGITTHRASFFHEGLLSLDLTIIENELILTGKKIARQFDLIKLSYNALVLSLTDYLDKNGYSKALVCVSGGIDSALVLAIVWDVLGKDNVEALYLPSRYSTKLSTNLIKTQVELLKIEVTTISIEMLIKACLKTLPKNLTKSKNVLANLQARCRALIAMAFSNGKNTLIVSTSNKSEMYVGYTTLYGDMTGGFDLLKDIPKTLVYELARYRNGISYVIPREVITREPTAELIKNQKDSDDLPPYLELDEILKRYFELGESKEDIIKAGFKHQQINETINRVYRNEYKRRQAVLGPKISSKSLDYDSKYPLNIKYTHSGNK